MNEAREIRLRVLEMLVRTGADLEVVEVETVLRLERFVMAAGVAETAESVDETVDVAAEQTEPGWQLPATR